MTREPDRFDKQARETLQMLSRSQWSEKDLIDAFAAALRQAADEMRQASIDACDDAIGALQGDREVEAALECIKRIRSMKSPAAAPAAEPVICDSTMDADELFYHCTLPPGHVGPHKDRDVAEWTDAEHHDGEPVAPAPSDLIRLLERIRATAKGHMEYFAGEIFSDANEALRILLASPVAKAKEPRKP